MGDTATVSERWFSTLHEDRAYSLAKHLRNAGLSPELTFGRPPGCNFIYRSSVKVRCSASQWDDAMEAMYEESKGAERGV